MPIESKIKYRLGFRAPWPILQNAAIFAVALSADHAAKISDAIQTIKFILAAEGQFQVCDLIIFEKKG